MAIFSAVIAPTKKVVKDILADENYREMVTYRRTISESFDDVEGHVVPVVQDTPLEAVRMRHNKNSVRVSSSPVEVGDLLFLFDFDSFPAEHSVSDVVIDAAGVVYGIKGIDPMFTVAVAVTLAGTK